jgi:hypothetical protein
MALFDEVLALDDANQIWARLLEIPAHASEISRLIDQRVASRDLELHPSVNC